MNCPRCGARNPRDAAWCTQCFEAFRAEPDTDAAEHPASNVAEAPVRAADESTPATAASARSGDVRVTGELVEWRCRRCNGWNALESSGCGTCGAPREGFGTSTSTPTPMPTPEGVTTARLASVLLPGLGHLLLGSIGTGVARALLFVLWVAGGFALVGDAPTGGLVLFLGALVLWAVTLVDVQRSSTGRPELLGPRGLGALVGAVTVLLVFGAALRVVGA